jgi:hypothetical protein
MKYFHAFIVFLGLALLFPPAASAQQIRPYSGSGVVIVRPLNPERPADMAPIPFYRYPGVSRIADISAGRIPRLSTILNTGDGEYPLAVMGKRGNWLRIAYDDAGREGWVEKARWWDYITWENFLKGRIAHLLPGSAKNPFTLREGPAESTPQGGTLSGRESLRIIAVADDWVLVMADSGLHGWLPWRDGDGRFLIAVDENSGTQNH